MNDNIIADFFLGSFTLFKKGDRAGGGESGGWETRTRKHSDFTIDNDKIIADFFLGEFPPLKKGDRGVRGKSLKTKLPKYKPLKTLSQLPCFFKFGAENSVRFSGAGF